MSRIEIVRERLKRGSLAKRNRAASSIGWAVASRFALASLGEKPYSWRGASRSHGADADGFPEK